MNRLVLLGLLLVGCGEVPEPPEPPRVYVWRTYGEVFRCETDKGETLYLQRYGRLWDVVPAK